MISKLALKRLTASDLTFFEWHLRHRNAGNQKAINLNADVFRDQLYPSAEIIARNRQNKFGVDLWVAGPGAAEKVNLQRKIIKGASYKNWRLDGEIIHNPQDQPDRFNVLVPDDIVLFGFEGELVPNTVTLVLVAKASEEDKFLFSELENLLGTRRMISLDADSLRKLCERLSVSSTHPVWLLVTDEDFVDAGVGLAPAIERLLGRPRLARMSIQDLRNARKVAEEIGRFGEELVDFYLRRRLNEGEIAGYKWVSDFNAIAPHDFRIDCGELWEKFEIKTTRGNFGREYYLSHNELKDMVYGGETYRIGRLYRATPDGAKMKISSDLRGFGQTILDAFSSLPSGVRPNGISITPEEAMFGAEITLTVPDDED